MNESSEANPNWTCVVDVHYPEGTCLHPDLINGTQSALSSLGALGLVSAGGKEIWDGVRRESPDLARAASGGGAAVALGYIRFAFGVEHISGNVEASEKAEVLVVEALGNSGMVWTKVECRYASPAGEAINSI